MDLKYKNGEDVGDSVGLLISILVRYPEVGTINYEPAPRHLKFSFMIARAMSDEDWASFANKVRSCLETFNFLEGRCPQEIGLRRITGDNLTILELERDVDSLTQDEIALITGLIQQEFPQELLSEQNDALVEEDLLMQEELIGHMLENMKGNLQERKLIAFREEGRVLVFNK